MFKNLYVFCYEHPSVIFDLLWKDKGEIFLASVADSKLISFDDIYKQVWKPTIACCESLLYGLYQRSIPLSDVKQFCSIKNTRENLLALCDAMCQCYPDSTLTFPVSHEWISKVVIDISSALQISDKVTKIDTVYFFTLKDRLKLQGDFSVLQEIDYQVCMHKCGACY